jgi:hypothetical protein
MKKQLIEIDEPIAATLIGRPIKGRAEYQQIVLQVL